jgi:hypothetical protein
VPAGNVGVKDLFGSVAASTLSPGIGIVLPLTRIVNMSVQTQEIKEVAEVPSQEGLILTLETSLLFQLDPAKAVESTGPWAATTSGRSSSRSSDRRSGK